MLFQFNSSFSRSLALIGMLGLGLVQGGCAHPVVVEPSVSVHSRIGHFPVYSQVRVPGSVYYGPPRVIHVPPPPPRVIYVPPPPPRVVYVPRAHPPAQIWDHGHNRWHRGQERRQYREDERERGGGRDRDGRGQRDQWRH